MIRSSLRDYLKNTLLIFKNWVPFTNFVSVIYNIQVDDAQDFDIVVPMYKLI